MSDAKALKDLLKNISKMQGVVVSQIQDFETPPELAVIPSGSYTLDYALGINGFPRGRIIEIFGKESGGKTTLSLLAIAEAQKLGGVAAFIDVEHSLDVLWAKKLGVNVDKLIFTQPESAEQALSVVEELAQSNLVDMIVVDSVAGLIPKQELEGDLGDQTMGLQARMMSQALRRLVGVVGKSKAILLFINQVRETMNMYGEKETTPGGKALKFYSSIRLSVKKVSGSEIKSGQTIVGHRVSISVRKNKVAAPFREAEFALRYNSGIDRSEELIMLAVEMGLIEQSGPMYKFKEKTFKGLDKLIEGVLADELLQKELWSAIQEKKTNG